MITIISGNIEAWLGISAVHIYLFLEQFYNALVEAQIVRRNRRSRLSGWVLLMSSKSLVVNMGRRATKWRPSWIFGQQGQNVNPSHRQSPSANADNIGGPHHGISGTGARQLGLTFISGILVSILTKLKRKLARLFTHISFNN